MIFTNGLVEIYVIDFIPKLKLDLT